MTVLVSISTISMFSVILWEILFITEIAGTSDPSKFCWLLLLGTTLKYTESDEALKKLSNTDEPLVNGPPLEHIILCVTPEKNPYPHHGFGKVIGNS